MRKFTENIFGQEPEKEDFDARPRMVERRMIGSVNLSSDDDSYVSFDDAAAEVRKSIERIKAEKIKRVDTKFSMRLVQHLAAEIDEAIGTDGDKTCVVNWYPALGSKLDTLHGVDAFIEVILEPKYVTPGRASTAIISLDVTTNEHKLRNSASSSDIVVGPIEFPDEEVCPSDETLGTEWRVAMKQARLQTDEVVEAAAKIALRRLGLSDR